ncbi:MAG: hypothetical protein ACTSRK_11000 [Promethearchaeota archaeon]
MSSQSSFVSNFNHNKRSFEFLPPSTANPPIKSFEIYSNLSSTEEFLQNQTVSIKYTLVSPNRTPYYFVIKQNSTTLHYQLESQSIYNFEWELNTSIPGYIAFSLEIYTEEGNNGSEFDEDFRIDSENSSILILSKDYSHPSDPNNLGSNIWGLAGIIGSFFITGFLGTFLIFKLFRQMKLSADFLKLSKIIKNKFDFGEIQELNQNEVFFSNLNRSKILNFCSDSYSEQDIDVTGLSDSEFWEDLVEGGISLL